MPFSNIHANHLCRAFRTHKHIKFGDLGPPARGSLYLQCSHNESLDHLIYTGTVLPFHLSKARLDPKNLLAWTHVSNLSYRTLLHLGRPKIGTRLMKAARVEPHVVLGTINNSPQYPLV